VRLNPLALALLCCAALPAGARADATRSLEGSLAVAAGGSFGVENLVGAIKVVPAAGHDLRLRATVHAESEELAASLSLATVTGKHGEPTLRVVYPLDRYDEFRYAGGGTGRHSSGEYAGHKVRISGSRGVLVYADLVVEVPAGATRSRIATLGGSIEAERVEGGLRFDTGSGPISIAHSKGELTADTGSGQVSASDVHGSFRCDTGSGECRVEDFEGDLLSADTGSGAVLVTRARAARIKLDTGSGQVRLVRIDAEEVSADTGSGPVELEAYGSRLKRFSADTGSGAVRLQLPADAGFVAKADVGGGRLRCDFQDAKAIVEDHEVVGYRRGDGRVRVDVDTGSGGLTIEPAR
jgi:Toastrack DUF4097